MVVFYFLVDYGHQTDENVVHEIQKLGIGDVVISIEVNKSERV